jgi:hypothetical protein
MKKNLKWIAVAGSIAVSIIVVHGCGKSSSSGGGANIPYITPIVKSAAPSGFGGSNATSDFLKYTGTSKGQGPIHTRTLSSSDINSRFFQPSPTDIYTILANIDGLIQSVNNGTGSCYTQTPVSFTVTPFGETVTMYAQCSYSQPAQYVGDPGFGQFGINNNLIYFYSATGLERIAAIITPLDASGNPIAVTTETITVPGASPNPGASPQIGISPLPSSYQAEVWIGLGYAQPQSPTGAWDSGSYGGMHLIANSVKKTFELTVAGSGFGYCGAQLRSDGTNVFITASADMSTTCGATDTACVLASDGITAATCGTSATTFSLVPMGRAGGATQTTTGQTYGASQYPGGSSDVIVLNGTTTDSLRFGPLTATAGTTPLQSL